MAELTLYDTLLSLPLFLGMSRSDLQQVAGQTKFDFRKYAAGETIVRDGEECSHLYFPLNGTIDVSTEADDHGYRIEEQISAPEIFQPECLFGLHRRFTHTYTAHRDCNMLCLDKNEVQTLSQDFVIFRINLLNFISAQTQKNNRRLLRVPPRSVEEHIVRFFEARCLRPAGRKTFHIKMNRIAEEVNDSRLDVSHALNRLQQQGLLQLERGRIIIPALERLISHKTE